MKKENVELQIYAGASTLLDKFGKAVNLIESEGFEITAKFFMLVEGETPETMAMSTGLGITKITDILMNVKGTTAYSQLRSKLALEKQDIQNLKIQKIIHL